jgi:hypothetical protein
MVFRRGGDIDFTALKKRGLLRIPEPKIDKRVKMDRDGSIDFTGMASSISNAVNDSSSTSNSAGAVSPFGFLDSLSSASSSSSSSLDAAVMQPTSSELGAVKIKLDDLDFKIGQFVERMEKIESKLLEFESKVG